MSAGETVIAPSATTGATEAHASVIAAHHELGSRACPGEGELGLECGAGGSQLLLDRLDGGRVLLFWGRGPCFVVVDHPEDDHEDRRERECRPEVGTHE